MNGADACSNKAVYINPDDESGRFYLIIKHSWDVVDFAFSGKSNYLATIDKAGNIKCTNLLTGEDANIHNPPEVKNQPEVREVAFAFSVDEKTLATAFYPGLIVLCNLETNATRTIGSSDWLNARSFNVKWSADNSQLIISSGNSLRMCNLHGEETFTQSFPYDIKDFALSPCGQYLFLGSDDQVEIFSKDKD